MRAMEMMEHQLHAAMWGGLTMITNSVSELEKPITNGEGHITPSEDDGQEDICK